jgi:beta-lactamase class A
MAAGGRASAADAEQAPRQHQAHSCTAALRRLGWQVACKTSTGSYGSASDTAAVYPPGKAPLGIAIYTRQSNNGTEARNDVIFHAARIALEALAGAAAR